VKTKTTKKQSAVATVTKAVNTTVVARTPTAGTIPAGALSATGSSIIGIVAAGTTSTSANRKVAGFRLNLQAMLSGVQTYLPSDASLPTVNAAPLTAAALTSEPKAVLNAYATVAQLAVALKQARLSLLPQVSSARTLYAEAKQALTTFLGPSNPALAHFGLPVKTARRKPDAAAILASVVKAKGTRVIRHTMGSRQKAALKFQGSVVVNTQLNAPAATTVSAAPSAPAAAPAAVAPAPASGTPPSGS